MPLLVQLDQVNLINLFPNHSRCADFRNAIVKLDEFLLLTFAKTSAIALSFSHFVHHRSTTEPVVYAASFFSEIYKLFQ
jgi:hypothetical protein